MRFRRTMSFSGRSRSRPIHLSPGQLNTLDRTRTLAYGSIPSASIRRLGSPADLGNYWLPTRRNFSADPYPPSKGIRRP